MGRIPITVELLRAHGACGPGIKHFREIFPAKEHPDGVRVTLENMRKARRKGAALWFLEDILTSYLTYTQVRMFRRREMTLSRWRRRQNGAIEGRYIRAIGKARVEAELSRAGFKCRAEKRRLESEYQDRYRRLLLAAWKTLERSSDVHARWGEKVVLGRGTGSQFHQRS